MTSKKPGFSRSLLVLLIIVIVVGAIAAVVAVGFVLGPSLAVTTKNFAPYQSSVSQSSSNPSSITIADVNGNVIVSPWSQAYVLINGTVTARGLGSSTDAITFIESNSSGSIVFQAIFPASASFFSAGYSADIHVFVPSSYQFNTMQITNVNGQVTVTSVSALSLTITDTNGAIAATGIIAPTMTVTDTNGSINLACSACGNATVTTTNGSVTMNLPSLSVSGSYTVTTVNGNVNLTMAKSASCRITANTANGTVSSSGIQMTNHMTTNLGAGTATVNLTTTNGSISVTGT